MGQAFPNAEALVFPPKHTGGIKPLPMVAIIDLDAASLAGKPHRDVAGIA